MISRHIVVLLCSALCIVAFPQRGHPALAYPYYPDNSTSPTPGPPGSYPSPYPGPPSATTCDSKWKYIGQDLKNHFIDGRGFCTKYARQCIRLPFHDCFPDGGCDGSIILTDECTSRRENQGMAPMCGVLSRMSQQYGVGAADLINFAASVANRACPYGPVIPFYTGRTDNPTPAPPSQLPPPIFNADAMIAAFAKKGFTSRDLVALVGSHSVAYNHTGFPMDTTPGELDSCTYYKEVLTGDAPAILFSDHSLATSPQTERDWLDYAHDQGLWNAAYVQGMIKLITQGNDPSSLTDCTAIVYDLFL